MNRIITAIFVALCFIFFTNNVSGETDEEWHIVPNTINGKWTNTTTAGNPALPPTQTIDEVRKPNRTPLDEQLEILELWSLLTTLGTILFIVFLFRKTHIKKVRI